LTAPGITDYGPDAVTRRLSLALCALVLALAVPPVASAQDEERPGGSRGSYAWGEGSRAAEPDDPLRIQAFAGVGVGFRPLRNVDSPFNQDFLAPPYLDFGGAVFFPGGDLRHGAGLAVTSNLTSDGTQAGGIAPFAQWAITPSYHLLVPFRRVMPDLEHDWLQFQARVGIPLVFGSALSGGGMDFSIGGEVAAALNFKFLAGLGLYVELTAAVYGGQNSTVHPVISADAGFLFDYEVLP
jgi:hypothetical protein